MANTPKVGAAEKPGRAALSPDLSCAERVISSCYTSFQSFEQDIRDKEKSKRTSQETPYRALMDIADRAFMLASETKNLDNLQRAQILDVILRVAELMGRIRRCPREEIRLPIAIRYCALGRQWEEKTVTREVSLQGLSVECRVPVGVSDKIAIEALETDFRVSGRVRWARSNGPGLRLFGIEIENQHANVSVPWFVNCKQQKDS
jgi:hypothetical protein